MRKVRIFGLFLIIASIIFMIGYTYLIFFTNEHIALIVMKATIYLGVMIILALMVYVGYALYVTPAIPPEELEKILDEINKEEEY